MLIHPLSLLVLAQILWSQLTVLDIFNVRLRVQCIDALNMIFSLLLLLQVHCFILDGLHCLLVVLKELVIQLVLLDHAVL